LLLTPGVPLEVVADIPGHASMAINGDVAPDLSRGAVATLSAALEVSVDKRWSRTPTKRSGAVPDLSEHGP
jgi:hypothetical protein